MSSAEELEDSEEAEDDEDDEAVDDEGEDDVDDAPARRSRRRVRAVRVGPEGTETVIVLRGNERLVVVDDDAALEGDEDEDLLEALVPSPPGKAKRRRWRETFGISLRLQGAGYESPFGDARADLGGLGASFRWRPLPHFALEGGLDFFRGTGFRDDHRAEIESSINAMLYFNPQHRVQVYGLAGFHGAHAEVGAPVDDTWRSPWDDAQGRDYVGVQGGIGVEFRATRLLGFALDLVGTVRTKVDESAAEFVDAESGTTSNVYGGGRLRGAVNFWW